MAAAAAAKPEQSMAEKFKEPAPILELCKTWIQKRDFSMLNHISLFKRDLSHQKDLAEVLVTQMLAGNYSKEEYIRIIKIFQRQFVGGFRSTIISGLDVKDRRKHEEFFQSMLVKQGEAFSSTNCLDIQNLIQYGAFLMGKDWNLSDPRPRNDLKVVLANVPTVTINRLLIELGKLEDLDSDEKEFYQEVLQEIVKDGDSGEPPPKRIRPNDDEKS